MKIIILCFFCSAVFNGNAQQTNNPNTALQQADSLFEIGNWKGAAVAYEASLKANSKDGRAWYRLGAAYQAATMYPRAIEAYKESLQAGPGIIPAVFVRTNLAKTYSLSKDSAKTFALLTDMLNNGYGNFPDLNSAGEYLWLRSTPQFAAIVSKATSNAYPCTNNAQNQEFDFWVGEWNVYQTGTNYQVGKQKIEKASGGCLIVENWTATGFPNEGKSMNFISPKTGKWEQVWMGSAGQYLNYYNGEYKDAAMRFEGDGADKAGNKILFRLTYYNNGPGKLRQLLEQSTDGGKKWSTTYDFSYNKAH